MNIIIRTEHVKGVLIDTAETVTKIDIPPNEAGALHT